MKYRIHGTNRSKDITLHKIVLNDWIMRPKNDIECCPLSSAIQVQIEARTRLEKINVGATGYAVLPGNDIQHENIVCFMSSAFSNGNGLSITPDNFEKAMISIAVRKVITHTWLNDRDQFQISRYVYDNEQI